jgi:hypothetical protein
MHYKYINNVIVISYPLYWFKSSFIYFTYIYANKMYICIEKHETDISLIFFLIFIKITLQKRLPSHQEISNPPLLWD